MHGRPHMNLTKYREQLLCWIDPVARAFARLGLTPNQITLLSTAFGAVAGLLFALGHAFPAGAALIASGLLDYHRRRRGTHHRQDVPLRRGHRLGRRQVRGRLRADRHRHRGLRRHAARGRRRLRIADQHVHQAGGLCGDRVREERGRQDHGPAGRHRHLRAAGDHHPGPRFSALSGFTFFGYGALAIAVGIVAVGTNLSALQRIWYLYRNRDKF